MGFFENQVSISSPITGIKTYIIPTMAKDVVTFSGSFRGGSIHCSNNNSKISTLTSSMIDKGTTTRNKFEISETLDAVGAEIKFGSTQHHTFFTCHCLKDNIAMVIDVLSDELKNPLFDEVELKKLKKRMIGQIEQSREDTKKQAHILFSRELYPKNHLNYRLNTDETIEYINSIKRDDLEEFHSKTYGLGTINIAAAGDIDGQLFNDQINKSFSNYNKQNLEYVENKLKANPSDKID